ncbi:hypothetical protein V6N13_088859 [Hibiscus sabdariffa]
MRNILSCGITQWTTAVNKMWINLHTISWGPNFGGIRISRYSQQDVRGKKLLEDIPSLFTVRVGHLSHCGGRNRGAITHSRITFQGTNVGEPRIVPEVNFLAIIDKP